MDVRLVRVQAVSIMHPKRITRNFKQYPYVFLYSSLIYQIWYNGLDSDRFCAPEHIIQMSNSSICWPFGEKRLFHPNYYFFRIEAFFSNSTFFHCFPPNPYTRRCVSTIESLSLFRDIVKNHGKIQVISWFFGFSLIFYLSVYFNYL